MNGQDHSKEWGIIFGGVFVLIATLVYLNSAWWLGQLAGLIQHEVELLLKAELLFEDWFGAASLRQELDALLAKTISEQPILTFKEWAHGYYKIPAALLGVLMAGTLALRARPKFSGMLSLAQLDIFISRFYYPSRPIVGRGYERRDPLRDKSARFAQKPWEFAMANGLLLSQGQKIQPRYSAGGLNAIRPSDVELGTVTFDELTAVRVFAKQLGPKLNKPDSFTELSAEYRALLVAIAADTYPDIEQQIGPAEAWLKQFATSFWSLKALQSGGKLPPLTREQLDMTGVDDALVTVLSHPAIKAEVGATKFSHVALLRIFAKSRMSTAKMLWLKPVNRTLFYTLNNVGRPRRLFVEGHAPHAHDEAERLAGAALTIPEIEGFNHGAAARTCSF